MAGHLRRPYHLLCGVLLAVCVAGMAVSLTFNLGALAGIDWSGQAQAQRPQIRAPRQGKEPAALCGARSMLRPFCASSSVVFWFCQGMLLIVYLPICIEIVRTRNYRRILEPRRWQRRVLWGIVAYYTGSFYFFLYRAGNDLEASFTWEMISAGMILAFSIAATHYSTRYSASRPANREKEAPATLPSA